MVHKNGVELLKCNKAKVDCQTKNELKLQRLQLYLANYFTWIIIYQF